MLRDGVCDELTNTARCLFDGGDCCLEDKVEDFCKVCTCKRNVDNVKMSEAFQRQNVMVISNTDVWKQLDSSLSQKVTDVESEEVCSDLCLEPEIDAKVNAWQYQAAKKICNCHWIPVYQFCNPDIAIDMLTVDEYYSDEFAGYGVFYQTVKSLDCGISTFASLIHKKALGNIHCYRLC